MPSPLLPTSPPLLHHVVSQLHPQQDMKTLKNTNTNQHTVQESLQQSIEPYHTSKQSTRQRYLPYTVVESPEIYQERNRRASLKEYLKVLIDAEDNISDDDDSNDPDYVQESDNDSGDE
jgi:hypothetical protein